MGTLKTVLCVLWFFPLAAYGQPKAFPSAYGAGAYATGGRGGTVVYVTNLNDSGAGSFRNAVSAGNRIVVFDVSGTIELTSDLYITSDNLTIAGQSAPEGGITLTGKAVFFQDVQNVIVRYLRFRPDYNSSGAVDALNVFNAENFIVDHCSVSWGGDEAFSIRGDSAEVTVQNCIIGESATGMLAGDSSSPLSNNFSIIGNLWYNISHRFPNINARRTDVINNVVYNWYSRLMVVASRNDAALNEMNNFYYAGETTSSPPYSVNWLDIGSGSERSGIRVYTDGNVYPPVLAEGEDNWELYVHRFDITGGAYGGTSQWDPAHRDFQESARFPLLGEVPLISTAEEALSAVPVEAGANKSLNGDGSSETYHDDIDKLYLLNVQNRTSEPYVYPPVDIVNKQSYMDFHNAVTSEPANRRPEDYDSNKDGMPDEWKISRGFGVEADLETHVWPSGYVGVEEFLNEVDGPLQCEEEDSPCDGTEMPPGCEIGADCKEPPQGCCGGANDPPLLWVIVGLFGVLFASSHLIQRAGVHDA